MKQTEFKDVVNANIFILNLNLEFSIFLPSFSNYDVFREINNWFCEKYELNYDKDYFANKNNLYLMTESNGEITPENKKQQWFWLRENYGERFYFRNLVDAIEFKLRWG